ncbi:MAG: metal-dependent hydrolase [Flavisolibacter sp.]|nr:metal-dependent hydrolase [Flavisolibacter sp.]
MKLTYYGHSCFSVEAGGKQVLFDPFITPNELAKGINIDKIKADYILLSHGHSDHVADCEKIAKNTNATVVAAFEVIDWVSKKGITKTHPMNHGGKKEFDFGTVRCVNAIHSSSLPDGTYGGNPMGFIVLSGDQSFYYSGDTALTIDMQLIPLWSSLDFAVLCIGDNFTMGYEDAIEAARMIECKTIVGVHYDTFPYIKIDHQKAKDAFREADITLHLPEIGESIELKRNRDKV